MAEEVGSTIRVADIFFPPKPLALPRVLLRWANRSRAAVEAAESVVPVLCSDASVRVLVLVLAVALGLELIGRCCRLATSPRLEARVLGDCESAVKLDTVVATLGKLILPLAAAAVDSISSTSALLQPAKLPPAVEVSPPLAALSWVFMDRLEPILSWSSRSCRLEVAASFWLEESTDSPSSLCVFLFRRSRSFR